MPLVNASKGYPTSLLSAVTTGTGVGVSLPKSAAHHRIKFKGAGTITGGTILLEEANAADESGTWSLLYTIVGTGLTAGAAQIIHLFGTFGAIRARLSSDITGGGTVSADVTPGN